MAKKKPDPVDIHVGKNIRVFRLAKGLSQSAIGDALGVTFQQIQKYERGVNRVGSSRLAKLSKVLGVPMDKFFADSDLTGDDSTSKAVTDILSQPYAIRLLRALGAIRDNRTRLAIVQFTEAISEGKK
jgi:transcriptional regulator with XRE-family HTH domain